MFKKLLTPITVFIASLLLFSLVGYLWLQNQLEPVNPADTEKQLIVIPKGATITSISDMLHQKQLIRHPLAFKYIVSQEKISKNIQAGTFKLAPSMNATQIAHTLTQGKPLDFWVTILEGWRREEIAAQFAQSFQENELDFDQDQFLQLTQGKEGRLFPDTYLVPVTTTESTVATMLENTFNEKISTLQNQINQSGFATDDVVTMASLIEREAKTPEARRLVSGILWKRYQADWPLQVDATLQYASGYSEASQSWWKSPTAADKDIDSPYNTYQNTGLPPGPICSPSLSSLQAAADPQTSEYWYYITGRDGTMHYAETLEGHNYNIDRYLR